MKAARFILGASVILSAGCASIVSDSRYPVSISSSPSEANFIVMNKKGNTVHAGRTPATVTLKSGAGFFSGETYTLNFDKEGHEPVIATLDSSMDGWYVGNILFGGLIGILIVDPATGAMWKLDDGINVSINPAPTAQSEVVAQTEAIPSPLAANLDATATQEPTQVVNP